MECNGLISKELTSPSDQKSPKEPNSARTAISLLEGDELFFNRLLSREISKGFSSRIYYRVAAGKVPFEWEVQPGTPKNALESSAPLPPLSPPPTMLSLSLARHPPSKGSSRSRLWFWKKKVAKAEKSPSQNQTDSEESFGSWSCEGDSTWSSSSSRRTSSSSSSSFGSPLMPPTKQHGPKKGKMVKDEKRRIEGLAWSCTLGVFKVSCSCMTS